jgi:DNA-binding XRE family transcriptional regulator
MPRSHAFPLRIVPSVCRGGHSLYEINSVERFMTASHSNLVAQLALPGAVSAGTVRSPADFGTHLRTARRTRGITQAQAALLAGVGVRLWNEAENGRRAQVGLETALRMLAVVGVELRVAAHPLNGHDTSVPFPAKGAAATSMDGQVSTAR